MCLVQLSLYLKAAISNVREARDTHEAREDLEARTIKPVIAGSSVCHESEERLLGEGGWSVLPATISTVHQVC